MGPTKIAFLAWKAWGNDKLGEWPVGFPESERRAYDFATIRKCLEVFITRFFETSQFKRSCLPNGHKVSAGSALSPRRDCRAPSDSVADARRQELAQGLLYMRPQCRADPSRDGQAGVRQRSSQRPPDNINKQ